MTMLSIHDESETTYLWVAVRNEISRLEDSFGGAENAPLGGWRNTAVQRIAEREGMNPYALDRIIRGRAPKLSTPDDIDSRTGQTRLLEDDYRLHADHIETIRLGLLYERDKMIPFLGGLNADYWYDELWAIERACRALGIES